MYLYITSNDSLQEEKSPRPPEMAKNPHPWVTCTWGVFSECSYTILIIKAESQDMYYCRACLDKEITSNLINWKGIWGDSDT